MNPEWKCKRCDLEYPSSQKMCLICGGLPVAAFTTPTSFAACRTSASPQKSLLTATNIMSPFSPRSAGSTSQVLRPEPIHHKSPTLRTTPGLNREEKQKLSQMMERTTDAIRSLSPDRSAEERAHRYANIQEAVDPKYTKYRSSRPGGDVILIPNEYLQLPSGRPRKDSTSTTSGPAIAAVSPSESHLNNTITSLRSYTSSRANPVDSASQQGDTTDMYDAIRNLPPISSDLGESLVKQSEASAADVARSPSSMDQAMRLLIERIESLEVENGQLKEELNSTKVKLATSLSREADSTVNNELANDCIRDLQDHLQIEKARVDVPRIVCDEFEVRCSDLLDERNVVLEYARSLMEDHQRLLIHLAEKKQIDVIAVEAAVQKNTTVVRLKDELTTMELRIGAAESLAKIRSAEATRFEEELQDLRGKMETSEIIWQQKEATWRREKLKLERDLSIFRSPKPVISDDDQHGSSAKPSLD